MISTANHRSTQTFPGTSGFDAPDFNHRLSIFSNDATKEALTHAVSDMLQTSAGTLKLVKYRFHEDGQNNLDHEAVYYGLHSVRKEMEDVKAVMTFLRQRENENQRLALNVIDEHLNRAGGVLALLCNQFADDDQPFSNLAIGGAIDAILNELLEVHEAIGDLRAMKVNDRHRKRRT